MFSTSSIEKNATTQKAKIRPIWSPCSDLKSLMWPKQRDPALPHRKRRRALNLIYLLCRMLAITFLAKKGQNIGPLQKPLRVFVKPPCVCHKRISIFVAFNFWKDWPKFRNNDSGVSGLLFHARSRTPYSVTGTSKNITFRQFKVPRL
jgi:hypothetical protein